MDSRDGRRIGWALATVITASVVAIWLLLWPPSPADHGLAAMEREQPGLNRVPCLIAAIENDPAHFRVDGSFYLRPGERNWFQLRDRDSIYTVAFGERSLVYQNFNEMAVVFFEC